MATRPLRFADFSTRSPPPTRRTEWVKGHSLSTVESERHRTQLVSEVGQSVHVLVPSASLPPIEETNVQGFDSLRQFDARLCEVLREFFVAQFCYFSVAQVCLAHGCNCLDPPQGVISTPHRA